LSLTAAPAGDAELGNSTPIVMFRESRQPPEVGLRATSMPPPDDMQRKAVGNAFAISRRRQTVGEAAAEATAFSRSWHAGCNLSQCLFRFRRRFALPKAEA
jgi:hypothetical protein